MSNRRQRELREQHLRQAREWAKQVEEEVALPSLFGFPQFDKEWIKAQRVEVVALHGRVSTSGQDLATQLKGAGIVIRQEGCWVKKRFGGICSGKSLKEEARKDLYEAVNYCKRHNIPLVTPCFSRLVRHDEYHQSFGTELRPGKEKIEELMELLKGVTVATIGDPDDVPPQDETTLKRLSKLAKESRGRKPKTPLTKLRGRKSDWLERVMDMRGKGMSFQAIADYITKRDKVPISAVAVCRWMYFLP